MGFGLAFWYTQHFFSLSLSHKGEREKGIMLDLYVFFLRFI